MGGVICEACGRPRTGNLCLECPHAALRTPGEAPVYLSSPLTWPELSPRGRNLLRVLIRAPRLAEEQGLSPEKLHRGLLRMTVKISTT